jgi:hypothetical protein
MMAYSMIVWRMDVLLSCPVFLSASEALIPSIWARSRALVLGSLLSLIPLVACHRRGPRRFPSMPNSFGVGLCACT